MMRLEQGPDTLVVEGVGAGRDEERLLDRYAEQACAVDIGSAYRRGRKTREGTRACGIDHEKRQYITR